MRQIKVVAILMRPTENGERREVLVTEDEDQFLICSDHRQQYAWCPERVEVIQNGLDAELLWDSLRERSRTRIETPLAPKEGLWIPLNLISVGQYRAKVFVEARVANKFHLPDDGWIGSLNAGEGRAVLAHLCKNILTPILLHSTRFRICKNNAHGVLEQAACDNALASGSPFVVMAWKFKTILRNGFCPPCFTSICEMAAEQGVSVESLIGD